ncbi:MAG: transposase [Alphaproteobacteria bacterium]|nr:transposase [Alphaproteobacteria bacterium]
MLIRIVLIDHSFGIRSERGLCKEANPELAYRWFCRLGLDGEVRARSVALSKNRHGRFRESDLLRCFFEAVVRRFIEVWSAARALLSMPAFSPTVFAAKLPG